MVRATSASRLLFTGRRTSHSHCARAGLSSVLFFAILPATVIGRDDGPHAIQALENKATAAWRKVAATYSTMELVERVSEVRREEHPAIFGLPSPGSLIVYRTTGRRDGRKFRIEETLESHSESGRAILFSSNEAYLLSRPTVPGPWKIVSISHFDEVTRHKDLQPILDEAPYRISSIVLGLFHNPWETTLQEWRSLGFDFSCDWDVNSTSLLCCRVRLPHEGKPGPEQSVWFDSDRSFVPVRIEIWNRDGIYDIEYEGEIEGAPLVKSITRSVRYKSPTDNNPDRIAGATLRSDIISIKPSTATDADF